MKNITSSEKPIQRYDELSLFLMAILMITTYLIMPESFQSEIYHLIDSGIYRFILLISLIAGAAYVFILFVTTLIKKKLKQREKQSLSKFVFIFILVIDLFLLYYSIKQFSQDNLLIILPMVNTSLVLTSSYNLYKTGKINEYQISDKQRKKVEFLIGLILFYIIFHVSDKIFSLYWLYTISILLSYIILLNKILFWIERYKQIKTA